MNELLDFMIQICHGYLSGTKFTYKLFILSVTIPAAFIVNTGRESVALTPKPLDQHGTVSGIYHTM